MPSINNPAGRLYAILNEVRGKGQQIRTRDVWANAFGIERDDTADILFMVGKMIELTRDAKRAIEGLDAIDHDLYLMPFVKIEQAFSVANLEGSWGTFSNHLDEGTMVALGFCADTLSRSGGEEVIDSETLGSLLEQVENLVREIMDSDIPQDLKAVLIENLEEIRRAIIEYRIRGVDGLRRALEGSLGAVLRHGPKIKEMKGKRPIDRFLEMLGVLDRVVAFGLKMQQLFGPVLGQILQIETSDNEAGPGS